MAVFNMLLVRMQKCLHTNKYTEFEAVNSMITLIPIFNLVRSVIDVVIGDTM